MDNEKYDNLVLTVARILRFSEEKPAQTVILNLEITGSLDWASSRSEKETLQSTMSLHMQADPLGGGSARIREEI